MNAESKVRLSREIRFALVPASVEVSEKPTNSWAGWPTTSLLVPQLKLQLIVSGQPETKSGYLCNIKVIDDLLRAIVLERLIPEFGQTQSAIDLLSCAAGEVTDRWVAVAKSPEANVSVVPKLESLILHVTACLRYQVNFEYEKESPKMNSENATVGEVMLTEQFEFSAAHRLNCPGLTDDENRQLFGKCNNPEGHGHNYVVEVTVAKPSDLDAINLIEFETIVDQKVIDRLDHKHLNRDVDYFSTVNPSVENIAIAIYNWLDGQLGKLRLAKVKVFETPKTWAEYSG